MSNIYVINSNDFIIINKKISDILNNHSFSSDGIIKYDLLVSPISDIIEDLNTYSMFLSNKIIVCYNGSILLGDKKKSIIDHNVDELKRYLNNINPLNLLIFVTDKINESNELVKLLKSCAKFINIDVSTKELIKLNIEDYKMDDATMDLLIEYAKNDNDRVLNELEKLKLYKFEDKVITQDDIRLVCLDTFDEKLYSLSNAIMDKNIPKALDLYYQFVDSGTTTLEMIVTIADYIRKIYQVKVLINDNVSYEDIMKYTDIKNKAQINVLKNKAYEYSTKELLDLLLKLSCIDLNIKKGELDDKTALDLFIIELNS